MYVSPASFITHTDTHTHTHTDTHTHAQYYTQTHAHTHSQTFLGTNGKSVEEFLLDKKFFFSSSIGGIFSLLTENVCCCWRILFLEFGGASL